MTKIRQQNTTKMIIGGNDNPLIAIPIDNNGVEEVFYFTSDEEADAFTRTLHPNGSISMAGIWRELDGNDMLENLDRIRHESTPTPPLENI